MMNLVGLDSCAPKDETLRRSPSVQVISALREDYQQLVTLFTDLSVRVTKVETFTLCNADNHKESLRLVEDRFYPKVQSLETQLTRLKGTVEELLSKDQKQSETTPDVGIFNYWQDQCNRQFQEAQILAKTIKDLQRNRPNEDDTDESSRTCSLDHFYKQELEKAIVCVRGEVSNSIDEKLKYWKDAMADQLVKCRLKADDASKDAQTISSRLDAIVEKQRTQILNVITFCLRVSLLEPSRVNACIDKLEKEGASLRGTLNMESF